MAKLKWGAPVVLYPVNESNEYTPGVAWNSITQISESPEGADNIPYPTLMSAKELRGVLCISCYAL